jgi:hypothetical protein
VKQIPLLPLEPPADSPNPDAFRPGQLAQYLFGACYAHTTALVVARHPAAGRLLPLVEPGQTVPVGRMPHKAPNRHEFHLAYYLQWAQNSPTDEYDRVFFGGALLAVGDALAGHSYFDHAPELELVRHLRNGVAHGNRFNITASGRTQLAKWPAHNRLAIPQAGPEFHFEVTAALNGREVLWSFIERGDIVGLLQAVSVYLIRMGNGDLLRP